MIKSNIIILCIYGTDGWHYYCPNDDDMYGIYCHKDIPHISNLKLIKRSSAWWVYEI